MRISNGDGALGAVSLLGLPRTFAAAQVLIQVASSAAQNFFPISEESLWCPLRNSRVQLSCWNRNGRYGSVLHCNAKRGEKGRRHFGATFREQTARVPKLREF